jgi:hypothetical protein
VLLATNMPCTTGARGLRGTPRSTSGRVSVSLPIESARETETGNALLQTLNFRVHLTINKRGHAQGRGNGLACLLAPGFPTAAAAADALQPAAHSP